MLRIRKDNKARLVVYCTSQLLCVEYLLSSQCNMWEKQKKANRDLTERMGMGQGPFTRRHTLRGNSLAGVAVSRPKAKHKHRKMCGQAQGYDFQNCFYFYYVVWFIMLCCVLGLVKFPAFSLLSFVFSFPNGIIPSSLLLMI